MFFTQGCPICFTYTKFAWYFNQDWIYMTIGCKVAISQWWFFRSDLEKCNFLKQAFYIFWNKVILLNVVPLSFLQKHFTYKRWTGNNWVILTCGILFLVYMSKLHSHVKNMGYREMGLVSMIVMLQFKAFLTKWWAWQNGKHEDV